MASTFSRWVSREAGYCLIVHASLKEGGLDADAAGMLDLDEALRYVVRKEGSDLHLKVPSRPLVRIHGRLEAIEHYEPLTPADTERVLAHMLGGHRRS